MINIYDSKETIFSHNGLVVLSDTISCIVEEELNGLCECTIEYPIDDKGKWTYLIEGNLVKADGQLYRIYRKQKTLTSVVINARHVYFDLLENLLDDVRPTNLTGAAALDYILTRTQYAHPFSNTSDVGGNNTIYFVRKNPIEAISEIINTYGGELKRDNFAISLMQQRGVSNGTLISYSKNIIGLEETLDTDGICTRIMPVGAEGLLLTEKYIDSQYINNYPNPKIKVIDFNDCKTEEDLRTVATNYMLNNSIDIPLFNYKVDFLELSKTEEYKNFAILETLNMADSVIIKHSKLNINLTAKVIKTTKDIISDRILKLELGFFKANLATTFNNSIQQVKQEIVQVTSDFQKAIENSSSLITGVTGGNLVFHKDANGKPSELLLMNTDSELTATKVWRMTMGGFGYSSTGVNGTYDTAITMDGSIVGRFITALEISGEQITAGIIKSHNGEVEFNLNNETFKLGTLTYDGENLVFGAGSITWGNLDTTAQTNLTGADGQNGNDGTDGLDGNNGTAGTDGIDGHDWSFYANKTIINNEAIATPNFFAGSRKGTDDVTILTGVQLNNSGLGGYFENSKTFSLNTDGSAVFGKNVGQQFIVNTDGSISTGSLSVGSIMNQNNSTYSLIIGEDAEAPSGYTLQLKKQGQTKPVMVVREILDISTQLIFPNWLSIHADTDSGSDGVFTLSSTNCQFNGHNLAIVDNIPVTSTGLWNPTCPNNYFWAGTKNAQYSRLGNMVTVHLYMTFSFSNTSAGGFGIGGLPIPSTTRHAQVKPIIAALSGNYIGLCANIGAGTSFMDIMYADTIYGDIRSIQAANLPLNKECSIAMDFTYLCD